MQLLIRKTDRMVLNLAPDDAVGAFDAYLTDNVVETTTQMPNDFGSGKYMFKNSKWVKNPNYTEE
jgi:hypothetical protein